MTVCTMKIHSVTEFDIVKSEQFTEVLSVVFGQFPQSVDRILYCSDGQFCVLFQENINSLEVTAAKLTPSGGG